jgi:hypothetical protein
MDGIPNCLTSNFSHNPNAWRPVLYPLSRLYQLDWAAYVEKNIHAKRHLFSNHIIQHYPGNLGRQGTAAAEANHSSVLQRLGAAFYESPVKLIKALLERHDEICGEKEYGIQRHRMYAAGKAFSSPSTMKKRRYWDGIVRKVIGNVGNNGDDSAALRHICLC